MTYLLIAVDGPAASGKGTIGRKISQEFNLNYLDTGKIYRALAYKVLEHNIADNEIDNIVNIATNLQLEDLSNKNLYHENIGMMASKISILPKIREALLKFQRDIAYNSPNGALLDGRDIATVICPDANLKFFITASLVARVKRRHQELINKGDIISYDTIYREIKKRDQRDRDRDIAPLKQADDAYYIDTTDRSPENVFNEVKHIILTYINK